MRPESRSLANALLSHHRATTSAHPPQRRLVLSHYVIPYGQLCAVASVPYIGPAVGVLLLPVAEWCRDQGFPALHALAVNGRDGVPGPGYDGAAGFNLMDWPAEVERCIRFIGYPRTVQ